MASEVIGPGQLGIKHFGCLTVIADEGPLSQQHLSARIRVDRTTIVAVVDATNLRMNLRLVLELAQLGRPLMVALNMADVARAEGLKIDVDKLAVELGCPVVETVAVRADGHAGLLAFGATDPLRFHPDQGTDLLAFLGGVLERSLRRWLA